MRLTPGPHLTFDEMADRGIDARPCYCWHAGHGDITGVGPDQVQHPSEWADGSRSAFETLNDL